MKFWDREKEKEWLKRYLRTEPNAILFIYGPKSSGKSTLLMKVAQELRDQPFEFLWYDLREYAIEKMEDAISVLLGAKGRVPYLAKLFDVNLYIISLNTEEIVKVFRKERDPFVILGMELLKVKEKGNTPVVVFDEIQNFRDIYLNGDRRLIDRLFNFFVSMTKVKHLAHVLVMTSDTFFIEEVYTNSALKNAVRYYLVDYFDDDEAIEILKNEGLPDETSRQIVEKAGGVPWVLEEVLEGDKPLKILEELYEQTLSRLYESLRGRDDLKRLLKRVLKGENLFYDDESIDGVRELVEREILFYDPMNKIVRFQTKLDEAAAREMFKE